MEACKNDKKYIFECENEAPLGVIFDVLCEFQAYVIEKMKESSPKRVEQKESDGCCRN